MPETLHVRWQPLGCAFPSQRPICSHSLTRLLVESRTHLSGNLLQRCRCPWKIRLSLPHHRLLPVGPTIEGRNMCSEILTCSTSGESIPFQNHPTWPPQRQSL